jgi:hypothetical protein
MTMKMTTIGYIKTLNFEMSISFKFGVLDFFTIQTEKLLLFCKSDMVNLVSCP